ncbi:MAG TPA: gliding motility-associated ABC transporter substrate-binding protein GldG [Chitinophagaceae bacterium]
MAPLAGFALVIYIASFVHYRADLTAEKRFSLSNSTRELLRNLDSTVTIEVFLTGDLSSGYRKLSVATEELLEEFKDYAGGKLNVKFERPGEDLRQDSLKLMLYDSLMRMGVVFEQTSITTDNGKDIADQFVIPSAMVRFGNRKPFVIDLRSSKTVFKPYDVINQNPEPDLEATRNAAEALLEFKFANAIDKVTRENVPVIAYLVGNGEPIDFRINDLGESLRNEYRLAVYDLKLGYPDPREISALMIVKPTEAFTDEDKLKLDQYVMHGGRILWFIDKLYAETDSLMRSQKDFVAFDRNLNLDDILFRYGVRINGNLLQDLNCAKLPLVVGQNPDGSPRMQRVPWPYYPFLSGNQHSPISKNLDRVLPLYPSTIDTVRAAGVQKTVLLSSDTTSRTLASPALVSINSVRTEEDFRSFRQAYLPVAVLLEGNFSSLFANRLTPQVQDSVKRSAGLPFAAVSVPTRQVVVSDADIVTNQVTQSSGPLPMGMIPYENYRFANREFFLNCVDYLVSNSGIFESRNKEFTLRLLDKAKVESDRNKWQAINIGLPVVIVLLAGLLLQWQRKRKYAA